MLNSLKGCSSTGALRIMTGEVRRFMATLSKADRQILYLRMQKRPFAQIAHRLGFKTHSAVLKRVRRIGKAYGRYIGEDLGFSEAKIVEKETLLSEFIR